jgi:D-threo-aldose 1-dehydrogenase
MTTQGIAALPRRILPGAGFEVSAVGQGGWLGRLDDPAATPAQREAAAVETVRRAVELGITYFDTSPSYGPNGESERHLGLGLRALAPHERARLRIATKVGTHPQRSHRYDAASIRWSVDQSLRILFAERLDVLLIHDPRSDDDLDVVFGAGGALEALETLKTQGVIGAIGMGVRVHRFLRRAIESGRFDVILTPYDYTLLRTSAAPPLSQGDLERARLLWRWCRERRLDLGALAMQFSLRHSHIAVTLVGSRTAQEVEDNVGHALVTLSDDMWAELGRFMATLPPPAPGGEAKA